MTEKEQRIFDLVSPNYTEEGSEYRSSLILCWEDEQHDIHRCGAESGDRIDEVMKNNEIQLVLNCSGKKLWARSEGINMEMDMPEYINRALNRII
ncbi:hypothetical protein SAMN05216390_1074 [Lachnospiraceae bacterium KH1T2]|nr:hypothetical protein SAMN05216390_1074 [Lachnospiraceae bacterium KH1T2]